MEQETVMRNEAQGIRSMLLKAGREREDEADDRRGVSKGREGKRGRSGNIPAYKTFARASLNRKNN